MSKRDEIYQFQKNLCIARCLRGVTQEKLASEIGVAQSYISMLEHGKKRLNLSRYLQIKSYFDELDNG